MELTNDFYELNASYYNTKWTGLVNFTSVQRAPVFNSMAHFYKADPKLDTFIEVYNVSLTIKARIMK